MQADSYFEFTRTEIETLLPGRAGRILELGCGRGNTLKWLKTRYPDAQTVGVEGWPGAMEHLGRNADVAILADLEQPLPAAVDGPFDLILALDILEHLSRPDLVLARAVEHLAPGGRVVVSLPNVAHISVSAPLLFWRRLRFTEAGITDRTHLRWFTEENAIGLLNEAGLHIRDGVINGLNGPRTRLLDGVTLGVLRHWLTKQYIMMAERGSGQGQVHWRVPRAARRAAVS